MLTIPTNIQTLVDGGRFSARVMLRAELGGGPEGVWNDVYPLSYGGLTYQPLGGNLVIEKLQGSSRLDADVVEVKMANLLPAVSGLIDAQDWHQRGATVFLAFLDDAGAVLHVMPKFTGFMDTVTISDQADGNSLLTLRLESTNRELNRSGGRKRSDPDQRAILSTDGFFKHTTNANTNTDMYWGRKGPQSPA